MLEPRNPRNTFETKQLLFRDIKMSDLDDVYALYSDPLVVKFDQSEILVERNDAKALINTAEQQKYDPKVLIWGVELKTKRQLIGVCGFKNWDRNAQHAEIGGCLASEYWGRGIALEALEAVLNYGFTGMGLNKVYGLTNSQNNNAINFLLKRGFHQDGTLRHHQMKDGNLMDVLIFSMLKEEYNS